ncbi:mitochondrial inner membrane protease ATP23 isoform X2 [Rosa chinensis]|uniref:mitochondrial inner membrane protease ATP23 isoform X2 n=1 Tax=Rosa chinensis TaxID=74649 RepID=UPI001AD8A3F1|nr:mitochondrial inner membrane protease ATP23 isoform X2 [Rosa chinensis]
MVKFLLEHLEKSGCRILDWSCWAVHCEKKIAGVYTSRGWIMVCSNHMNMQDEVNQVVIHELIHAFDDCRAAPMVNWANCPHHACSEIRAGHLSGDCHCKREFLLCQEDSRIVNKLSSLIKTLCSSKCNFHSSIKFAAASAIFIHPSNL